MVILLQGKQNQAPTAQAARDFAEGTGATVPITTDTQQLVEAAMPFVGAIPGKCVVSPEMELLTCYNGTNDKQGLEAIAAHAANQ